MKVLQIFAVYKYGSVGRIAFDLHTTLVSRGYDSYIAHGRIFGSSDSETIRIGNKWSVYKHGFLTRMFDLHGFASKKATLKLIDEIKRLNPDLIHLHNLHGYYINIEILFDYIKEVNTPVIWTFHDCWNFTGHCVHFDYVGCEKWEKQCFQCPQKRAYPASWLDNSKRNFQRKKAAFSHVNNLTIVTPSNWLAGLVRRSFLKDYPVRIINNGIDLNMFRPTSSLFRKQNNLEDKFIILGVANIWDQRKGLQYFLQLAKTLCDNEVIVLVGLSVKQKKQLPANIIGITRTNSVQQLAEIYSAADVFVNPTLEDNFPTTNLEALACGTPIITFNTGGSVESIDNKTGIVIEKGNLNHLRDAITTIKNNPLKSEDCLKRAQYFDKNIKFQEYIELYNDVLSNAK